MATRKLKFLFVAWLITFLFGLFLSGISAQGILRAHRFGEPVVSVDLSRSTDWSTSHFRLWGAGTYTLFISTVNHDSTHVGVPFTGDFEVAIIDSDGKARFQKLYSSGSIEHRLPQNYGDTILQAMEVEGWPHRRWTLQARVLKPDSRFNTGRSEIKFWKQRYDPGMGGMIYFILIFPAGFFLLAAAFCATGLARSVSRFPLAITLIVLIGYLWLFVSGR